ncbi:MAG: SufE family protein [Verrucomicrobiota bacterium]
MSTIAEQQRRLRDDLAFIEDPQERLAVVVERVRAHPPLPASERTEANRVPGCVSAVWLLAELRGGRLQLRFDADSPMVKGLVGLVVEAAHDAEPADAATAEITLIEDLGLHRNLTPTRRNGLAAVRARIRQLAVAAA